MPAGSNEEFDFTTRAPQQIQSGTVFGRRGRAVSPENPQVRYIATRGAGQGRTVGYFELNDGVNPPARITDEAARRFIQTNRLGSINTSTNVLPTLPPGEETRSRTTTARANTAPASSENSSEQLRNATFRESITPQIEGQTRNEAFGVSRTQRESFNISRFKSSVTSEDNVLPTHSFLVVFAPMPWALDYMDTGVTADTLTMRCDNAILPSLNLLQEQNIRRYGYGPVENVAYGVNVGDFTLQFIVDKQAQQFDFFEAWLNKIVNRDSYGGAQMNSTQGSTPYEIAYKDTYACSSINVFVYDRAQNTVLEYNIYDAYPTGLQSMNMSWSEENTLMRLNVSFTFTDFRIRPKISAFGQGAGTINGRSTLTPELQAQLDSEARVRAIAEEELRSALGNQNLTGTVVIGEGNNGVPRTVRELNSPRSLDDLARIRENRPLPAVYIPPTKNAFGQQLTQT